MTKVNRHFLTTRWVAELGVFSFVLNLLFLVMPIYLLQVYDRVLTSGSLETLVYISAIAVFALAVLGVLEVVRSQYAGRVGARLEKDLGKPLFLAAMKLNTARAGDVQPLRDMQAVRSFVSSRALFALFDLPFAPIFIAVLYLIHPYLFWLTLFGSLLLVAVAVINQLATSGSGQKSSVASMEALSMAQTHARNFETVKVLGMRDNVVSRWMGANDAVLGAADRTMRVNALFGGLSRALRIMLQIAVLGVGALLVLNGEMTAGMIFAASIVSGRALQPLDQMIGSWRLIVDAGHAWKRVKRLLESAQAVEQDAATELPEPLGRITVDNLVYYLPDSVPGTQPLIKRISFAVEPGESIAIIGPSRAGKSTLARLLVGAIAPSSGVVRLDGADVLSWDPDRLGRHIGYLSQEVELLPGTVAENIARFDAEADDAQIVTAAQRAEVHGMILEQKQGYQTAIGPAGVRLSGGERQRIGLARAFFGDPKLLVLDEPNANLDAAGEAALDRALRNAHDDRATVFIITHKPSIAAKCDRILMLRDGRIELFGPAAEVLAKLGPRPVAPEPAADAPDKPAMASKPDQSAVARKPVAANFGRVLRAKAK